MTAGLLIGIATGLVSALLFAQASTGTVLGLFVLFFLSPLPVAIAGLGWGWTSAAVAAAVGSLAVAFVGTGRAGFVHLLTLGAPTAIFSYLLLLSRPIEPLATPGAATRIEWYPVGRVVMWISLWAAGLSAIAVLTTATDVPALKSEVRQTIARMVDVGIALPGKPGPGKLGDAEIAALTEFMTATLPGVIASVWMTIATLNLWLAGFAVRASGRLMRPWPELATLAVPSGFPLLFGGAIAATFLPGMAGLLASGAASAFLFAYLLVGLAILHFVTRGKSFRVPLLGGIYLSLILFNPLSGLIVALIGVAEPVSPLRRRQPPGPMPPPTT